MSSRPNVAEPDPALLFSTVAAAALVLAAGSAFGDPMVWILAAVAFTAGGGAVGLAAWWWLYRPLAATAKACHSISSGDLSLTVPEVGPEPLHELARVTNDMAADFQEVLLLFAHQSRSALASADLLHQHLIAAGAPEDDRRRAAEIVGDVHEMEEMIREFKYFRVRFEDGRIVDSGLVHPEGESHEEPVRGTTIHPPDPFRRALGAPEQDPPAERRKLPSGARDGGRRPVRRAALGA